MTEKLKQKINEEILKLPKERQEAINVIDWGKITEEIGKKFLLTENEINNLQIETGLALVGLTDLDFYMTNIENNVGLTAGEANKITVETFDKIFTPIANKIESSIKNRLKSQKPRWNQVVNFIVSGGDYSNFIEK